MKKLILFELILIFILSISFISFSEATERKQPGVKYTDTLKQKRADKAASEGRVVPKQPGVKYSDTLKQVENNKRAAEGKIMNKIPGQSYRDTLSGTASSKDNKNRQKDREELLKIIQEKREKKITDGTISSKENFNYLNMIWGTNLGAEKVVKDYSSWFKRDVYAALDVIGAPQSLNYDVENLFWDIAVMNTERNILYSSFSNENYFDEIKKIKNEKEFYKNYEFPHTPLDDGFFNSVNWGFIEISIKQNTKKFIEDGFNKEDAEIKAEELVKKEIIQILQKWAKYNDFKSGQDFIDKINSLANPYFPQNGSTKHFDYVDGKISLEDYQNFFKDDVIELNMFENQIGFAFKDYWFNNVFNHINIYEDYSSFAEWDFTEYKEPILKDQISSIDNSEKRECIEGLLRNFDDMTFGVAEHQCSIYD